MSETDDVVSGHPSGRRPRVWVAAILVAALIGSAAYLAFPRFVCNGPRACGIDVTRAAIGRTGPFAKALKLYKMAMGMYPSTAIGLRGLVVRPADPNGPSKWSGPYIDDAEYLLDRWGAPYGYRYPGIHNKGSYDLWSAGPDGSDGTEDDITNWEREE